MFEIAIPFTALISVEAKENSFNVRYQWRGQERTIIGKLFSGEFNGKSDFGDMEISASKLSKLTFKESPIIPSSEEETAPFDTTLILTDGVKVPASNLKRQDSYLAGRIGSELLSSRHYNDFMFFRGESLTTIGFNKIKNITFQPDNKVSVTLKNGKQTMGTLSTKSRAKELDGFTGIYEKGEFFIAL